MTTVIVVNSRFNPHYPVDIPKNTVNAEAVLIRLDSEWDNLTVRIHWLNVASGVEKVVLLERDQPNTIPWEVLTDLGELRMGLVGLDGETVIKPTIWLTYGYVVDGVDPEAGSDPQPPTPSWEQQMVEQARVAAEAAEKAKDAAVNAEKAASQSGPYAEEAKKAAGAAKESQKASDTSAKQAANAKDQANIASDTAKDHADAAGTAKVRAERAAEMAGAAQSGAAQSAQTAANSAKEAETAKQEAQKAASILPTPSPEVSGKVPVVNPEGTGYLFGEAGGGKIDDSTLGRDTTWSSLKIVDSLAPKFESSGPVVTCNPVPGYPLSVVSQIVPVQAGDGGPSPDNVRPIWGYTGAKINIKGKNLFDISKIENVSGIVNNGDGTITVTASLGDSAIYTKKTLRDLVGDLPQGDYYLNATTTGISKQIYLIGVNTTWDFDRVKEITPEVLDSKVAFYASGVSTTATISDIYLSPATLSGPYAPYNADSKAVSVAFEDTVYGGMLNWTTGELSLTHICATIKSTEAWGDSVAVNGYILNKDFGIEEGGAVLCNIAPVSYSGGAGSLTASVAYGYVRMSGFKTLFPTLDEWKEFLDGIGGVQVFGKIKTPTIVKLAPTEILALSGNNTLYTDTGDTTVVGRADPDATIKGLLSRIDALEKAAVGGG